LGCSEGCKFRTNIGGDDTSGSTHL